MTTNQREKIHEYRQMGWGYTRIANAVGLSKDSVKAYCRRHNLGNSQSENAPDICPNCGTPITQISGRKHKKFCSEKCKVQWFNQHQQNVRKNAFYHFICSACGKEFTAYGNKNRKYCSHKCYINRRFHHDRQAV